jgi:type I restriction enzyme S subunit
VEEVGVVQLGRQRAPQHHRGTHMRPYLRVANVFEDRIDFTDVLEMNFSPREFAIFELQPNDILLNEGQSLKWVGRPAMYRGELPGACFQNTLIRFRAFEPINPRFALIVFRAFLHGGQFQSIAKWTTNIAHLGAKRFASMQFPLPPLEEQERIILSAERQLSISDRLETVLEANLKRLTNL